MSARPTIRALVVDVDGTLLTSDHRVSHATRAALADARAAGIRVVAASARAPAALVDVLDAVDGWGPAVCYGGALVADIAPDRSWSTLHEDRLPHRAACELVEQAMALGLEIGWHDGDRWLTPHIGEHLAREARITARSPVQAPMPPAGGPGPHKLLSIAPADRLGLLAELAQRVPSAAQAQWSHPNYLEITAAGADKGRAWDWLADHLGIPRRAAAAIGDGENDVGLLRAAGLGIAMGHAPAVLRAVAGWITSTSDQDGVARAVDRLQAAGLLAIDGRGAPRARPKSQDRTVRMGLHRT